MKENGRTEIEEQEFLLSCINREIRISLSGLKGYLYLMKEKTDQPDFIQECLDQMELSVQYLEHVMEDIHESSAQEKEILREETENIWSINRLKGARILIVDANCIGREILSRILSRNGAEVDAVSNREEARVLLEKGRYDSVLFDLKTWGREEEPPDQLDKLKIQERKKMNLIALTPGEGAETKKKLQVLGVDLVLEKPFSIEGLLEYMEKRQ